MKKETKKRALHRLKILEGQVRGLQRMVEDEEYCVDILRQTSAVKEALSSIENMILENHLATHVSAQIKAGKKAKAIKEIMMVYQLSKKK